MTAEAKISHILITGGGLIGGTLALDYAQKLEGVSVTIYDSNPQAAEVLRKIFKDKGVKSVSLISTEAALVDAARRTDLVDHCVPIDQVGPLQEKLLSHLQVGTVITNRGSAQAYAAAQIQPHTDPNRSIYHFGIHPVVGRERKPGQPLPIDAGTFNNQIAVMEPCPEQATFEQRQAHARLKSLNEALGFQIKELPLHIHDRLLGALSHENTLGLETLVNTRTHGVQSGLGATMMRASSGTTGMWLPIHEFNQAAIGGSCDIQMKHLSTLHKLLEQNDHAALLAYVQNANTFRSGWGDADQKIESLEGAIDDLRCRDTGKISPDLLVDQMALPFAVSIVRTHGVQETVDGLEGELARYGHKFTDLLNSSVKDSTLAARYDPEAVVDLMLQERESLLDSIDTFRDAHIQAVFNVLDHASGDREATQALAGHIVGASAIMAAQGTPNPRREGGGAGFDPLKNPVQAYDGRSDAGVEDGDHGFDGPVAGLS